MAKLEWDKKGERLYETGVSQGVLFVKDDNGDYEAGVAWNGLTAVNESPSGAEATPLYADDIKYLNLISNEEFGATIEAYTYPDAFAECNGEKSLVAGVTVAQQSRKEFGFCYKTLVGNDTKQTDYGYKLHIIYNAAAAPSAKNRSTVNASPEAMTMSWTITTTPEKINDIDGIKFRPTAHLTLDSVALGAAKMQAIEDVLFGSSSTEPELPSPNKIVEIINGVAG